MIFFAVAVFIPTLFLPWWTVFIFATAMGWLLPRGWKYSLQVGVAASLVWAGAGYYLNALNKGIIAQKMAGLFQLPNVHLIFLLTGLIAFISVIPFYWLGLHLRRILVSKS